jgi:hypothetical protein
VKNLVFTLFLTLFFLISTPVESRAQVLDAYDSSYISTLNMTQEEIEAVYGKDSLKKDSVTLQQINDENPTYIKREYDHKQQVIVGSVIMLCVALAMVFMNNYNPRR